MSNILVVNASPNVDDSVSRQLTARFVDAVRSTNPDTDIVDRDVAVSALPHLDQETIGAFFTPPDQRTDAQNQLVGLSDALVSEIFAAETIVIGTPMHNFGIPSGLKAWIDHVARVGVTFRYGENGPEGLLGGRKVIVMVASGGDYTDASPMAALNHVVPHLRTVLGFLGLNDVSVIEAPATAKGDDGIKAANAGIDQLVETLDLTPATKTSIHSVNAVQGAA